MVITKEDYPGGHNDRYFQSWPVSSGRPITASADQQTLNEHQQKSSCYGNQISSRN